MIFKALSMVGLVICICLVVTLLISLEPVFTPLLVLCAFFAGGCFVIDLKENKSTNYYYNLFVLFACVLIILLHV